MQGGRQLRCSRSPRILGEELLTGADGARAGPITMKFKVTLRNEAVGSQLHGDMN